MKATRALLSSGSVYVLYKVIHISSYWAKPKIRAYAALSFG